MFLHFLISLSMASTPAAWLVKAPQANPHEFFVFAQNSADTKISQAFTVCEQTAKINQRLKEAQFNFLNGSLEAAKEGFTAITEMKWNCDWKTEERKIITFAFFRLAQLSVSPSEQLGFLTEAVAFDDDNVPDVSIFPPPLVEMYRKTKAQLQQRPLLLPDFTKKFTGLLRNGKFISLNSLTLSTYPLRARFTFVSDSYRTETRVVTPEDLQTSTLEPRPLVEGSCETFSVAEELQGLDSYKIFFGPDCIKESKSAPLGAPPIANYTPNPGVTSTVEPRRKSWLERNILWVGAAVVGSIALAQMANRGHDGGTSAGEQPTNTLTRH